MVKNTGRAAPPDQRMRLQLMPLHVAAVLGIVLSVSCGTGQASAPGPEACQTAPADARPFQLADSLALVGRFDLVMVTTNRPSRQVARADLQLWSNPSSRQQRLVQIGYGKGARPIAGVAKYPDGRSWNGAADQYTTVDNPATELLDSTLYLGSPDPTDAIYTALHLERISSTGFWGRFDTSDGFQITFDSTGQRLPEAAGIFCAIRASET
jgi:hypothetical protein